MSTWENDVSTMLAVLIVLQMALDRVHILGRSKISQVFVSYIPDKRNLQNLRLMLKWMKCYIYVARYQLCTL